MRRTCAVLAALAVIGIFGHACPARAVGGTVEFFVDGGKMGELQCDEFPTAKPIVLDGRSGTYGDDRSSGLFDNVDIELFGAGRAVICDQDFTCYEVGYWTLYGDPLPVILPDVGNPAPCLMTAGDSWYDSGVASQVLYDWSSGFSFSADVRVDQDANFHGVEMGIADEDEPSDTGLGRIIGADWGHTGAGDLVFEMRTDVGYASVPGPAVGEWHRIEMIGTPSTAAERSTWGVVKGLYR
ncbi:MAG: hypothetical protein ABIG03_01380 [Candidatus Eisenbacteria bacterium]